MPETAQSTSVHETMAALVSKMLESKTTVSPEKLDGEENSNLSTEALDGLAQTNPETEREPDKSITPTAIEEVISTITPQITSTPNPNVESLIKSMTVSQKVGQMILTGVTGTVLTNETCQFIQSISPGGVIYLGSNITNPYPDQLSSLSADLQNCSANIGGIRLWIAIDHEGYYVNRFPSDSPMTIYPPAMAFGATRNPEHAYQAAVSAGQELRMNGINMILGPVADVLTNYDNTVISQRAYGGDPSSVADMVVQAVKGYLEAGVIPVLKHYPGHGGVSEDSHTTLPVDNVNLKGLYESHLIPFQSGFESGAPAVMVSHVSFPSIDPQAFPASLSRPLYRILDEDLDFHGFTMSDSMGMGAINSTGMSIEAASVYAINSGLDMLMLVSPELAKSVHDHIVLSVQNGTIPLSRIDQAVSEILAVKFSHDISTPGNDHGVVPDWFANQELADKIGYQAVSLHKDSDGLIPLPNELKNILIVGPGDGWGFYPLLRDALNQRGISYNIMTYSGYWYGPIPEANYLQVVPARALEYDLVLMFTWDSHLNKLRFGDSFQPQLVNSLLDTGIRMIVVALKSPTDILDFPSVPTYLASMGTTKGQLQGIIDVLLGETKAEGQIPLPNLP